MWIYGPTAHMSHADSTFTYAEQGKNQFNTDVDMKSAAGAVRVDTEPPRRHDCDDSISKIKGRWKQRRGWAEDLVYLRYGCQQLQTCSGSMGREMAFRVSGKLASPLEVQKRICI